MTCHHGSQTQRKYEQLFKRCLWMQLDFSLIQNLHDLRFQIEHEIDLVDDGGGSCTTAARLHRAKMLLADVMIAIQEEQRA